MPVDPTNGQPMPSLTVRVVARDISSGGIAVVHRGFLDWPELAVHLGEAGDQPVLMKARVVRVRPIGRNLYEIAGRFVERIGGTERQVDDNGQSLDCDEAPPPADQALGRAGGVSPLAGCAPHAMLQTGQGPDGPRSPGEGDESSIDA